MLSSLLCVFTLILCTQPSEVFVQEYVQLVSISDPGYADYEGFYFKNTTTPTICGTDTAAMISQLRCFATHFYKQLGKEAYLFQDCTPVYFDGAVGNATCLSADPTNVGASCGFSRLVLTNQPPCTNVENDEYILFAMLQPGYVSGGVDSVGQWGQVDRADTAMGIDGMWRNTTGERFTVDVCDSSETKTNSCMTGTPSASPTFEPTVEPTFEPTFDPTTEPTLQPTPTPTAPQVKYFLTQELPTSHTGGDNGCGIKCSPFTLQIGLFLWVDPVESSSFARITLLGPSDRSFMIFFTQYAVNYGGYEPWQIDTGSWLKAFATNGNSSGYVVNPGAQTAGEIDIDQTSTYNYTIFSQYTQNSNITESIWNYKGLNTTSLITFERQIISPDPEDWQFKLTELLDDFYVCYIVTKNGGFVDTSDIGCQIINAEGYNSLTADVEGNYGLRTKFESDTTLSPQNPPPFTIYLEYDPFIYSYSGYVIKPTDTWLLWGGYYKEAPNSSWGYATSVDIAGHVNNSGFASIDTFKYSNGSEKRIAMRYHQIFHTAEDDFGDGTHRVNFTTNRSINSLTNLKNFDMDNDASGWDTVKFFTTREMTFNIYYGDIGQTMKEDQRTGTDKLYSGPVSVFLDYVTYAPTLAPTMAPSLAPSMAPSVAPSMAPSVAPSLAPSLAPTQPPSNAPSLAPSIAPTQPPSVAPSNAPSIAPTTPPSAAPSIAPSQPPSAAPTMEMYACQRFCFAGSVNGSDVEIGWLEAVNAMATQSVFTAVDTDCSVIAVEDMHSDGLNDSLNCYECCASITGFSELDRWVLLTDMNENILTFRENLGDNLDSDEDYISAIAYAEANHGPNEAMCAGIPYPRTCLYEVKDSSGYYVSIGLDVNETGIVMEMCYGSGDVYFGVGFGGDGMNGDAVIYTTGISGQDLADIYDYTVSGKSQAGLRKDTTDDITEVMSSTENGLFCVNFAREFDTGDNNDNVFDGEEESILIWFAVGTNSLQLAQHSFTNRGYAILPVVPSPAQTDVYWCDDGDRMCTLSDWGTTSTTTQSAVDICGPNGRRNNENSPLNVNDKFTIIFEINCKREKFVMNITVPAFDDKWFGFVFSETMFGDALIYTTGAEGDWPAGLYMFENKAKSEVGVVYMPARQWEEVETSRRRLQGTTEELNIVMETSLDNTRYDIEDEEIGFRYATGDAMVLEKHSMKGDYFTVNLETGATGDAMVLENHSVKVAHGLIMFVCWGVLCAIGIMSSAFRYLYGANPPGKWFKVHKYVQFSCVALGVIGFGLIVYATQDEQNAHFSGLHQQLGLVVTIISVLQPLNALVRCHPPEKGHKKSTGRVVWECVHKMLGYGAWLLSQFVIVLGIILLAGQGTTWSYAHFVWVAVVIIGYFILWFVKCKRFGATDTAEMMDNVRQTSKKSQESVEMATSGNATKGGFTTGGVTKQATFVDEDEDEDEDAIPMAGK